MRRGGFRPPHPARARRTVAAVELRRRGIARVSPAAPIVLSVSAARAGTEVRGTRVTRENMSVAATTAIHRRVRTTRVMRLELREPVKRRVSHHREVSSHEQYVGRRGNGPDTLRAVGARPPRRVERTGQVERRELRVVHAVDEAVVAARDHLSPVERHRLHVAVRVDRPGEVAREIVRVEAASWLLLRVPRRPGSPTSRRSRPGGPDGPPMRRREPSASTWRRGAGRPRPRR